MSLLLAALLAVSGGGEVAGSSAFAEGRFEDALREVEAAIAGSPEPATLAQAQLLRARCLAALQRPAGAEAAFEAALLADPRVSLNPDDVSPELVALLERTRRRLTGSLAVDVQPAGSMGQLRIDETAHGSTPWRGELSVGSHRVELVDSEGKVLSSQQVVVRHQELTQVVLSVAAPPATNRLRPYASLRGEVDVRGGVASEVGGGVQLSWLRIGADLTIGAGVGATLRAGAAAAVVGPLTVAASLDGVLFFTPVVAGGAGATGELGFSLSPRFELYGMASFRWLSAPPGFRSTYGLVGLGVRGFLREP